ncbi:MAG: hypothetical protein LBE18_08055 [Planctomycetaceae bacterium]|nr:hypothetical protein [Planctomycetaceae bacterium]
MKRKFQNTVKQITGLLSLFVYLYALVLTPSWHSHNDNNIAKNCESEFCNNVTLHSYSHDSHDSHSHGAVYGESEIIHECHECNICKFLCTATPLFVYAIDTIETTDILFEIILNSKSVIVQSIHVTYSCRAPPIADFS